MAHFHENCQDIMLRTVNLKIGRFSKYCGRGIALVVLRKHFLLSISTSPNLFLVINERSESDQKVKFIRKGREGVYKGPSKS